MTETTRRRPTRKIATAPSMNRRHADAGFYRYVDIDPKDQDYLAGATGLRDIVQANSAVPKPGKNLSWSMAAYLEKGYLPWSFNTNDQSNERKRFSYVMVWLFYLNIFLL